VNAHARKLVVSVAVLVAALVGTSAVLAASSQGRQRTLFQFAGRLTEDAGPSATAVSVSVETGNKRALRALIGHSQEQTFAVGDKTEYLSWAKGVPTVVTSDALKKGDWVNVNIRVAKGDGGDLGKIEATPAGLVGDRGQNPTFAKLPLFLFRGKLTAAAADGKLSVEVGGGNRPALRKLLGHSADQQFSYGDGTIFLLWTGKVPTVISPDQLKVGDRITVRIRADRGSTLDQIEQTPARHVGEHEPASPPPSQS
jgi:hypothetical protein